MSTYENAPATKLLATHCACCARPLVDAVSVETGVGPDCRKAHGYKDAQGEPNWRAVILATDGLVSVAELGLPEGTIGSFEAVWRLGGIETRRVANILVHRIALLQRAGFSSAPREDVLPLVAAVRALGFTKLADIIGRRLAHVVIEREAGELVVRTPYDPSAVVLMCKIPGRRWVADTKRNHFPEGQERALLATLRTCFPGRTALGGKGAFLVPTATEADKAILAGLNKRAAFLAAGGARSYGRVG